MRIWLAVAGLAVWIGCAVAVPPAAASDALTAKVLDDLQRGRRDAGAPGLVRSAQLDEVARGRAAKVAARPANRRMGGREPIEKALDEAGVRRYRHVVEHLDMKRGYADPAAAFSETWRNYERAWNAAMDPGKRAIGLARVTASDGWVILVAVLVEELPALPDVKELERRVFKAINEIRREHGLSKLEIRKELVVAARGHSEDMAARDYFAHRSPGGLEPADRVVAAGVGYRKVAENIQLNSNVDDPAASAVEGWMSSRGHRRNILDPDFTQTGVGAAIDADGVVYFTQLFLRPMSAHGTIR